METFPHSSYPSHLEYPSLEHTQETKPLHCFSLLLSAADHVVVLDEQAQRMSSWSRSLNEDFSNEQSSRLNSTMYSLTLITVFFMPAQFLAGVEGMNERR